MYPKHKNNRPFRSLLLLAGMLALLLAGIRWAWHLPQVMDITFGDEAQYLRYGIDWPHIIQKDWGPSYNWWYKILSLVQGNPIDLFYLNYQVTAILSALLLFLFLIRYQIAFGISWWLAFCFLLSPVVIDTWPRVSHFAVILLLSCLLLIRNVASNAVKMCWVSFTFFLAAYARPELFASFVLSLLVLLYFLIKERNNWKKWLPLLAVLTGIMALVFAIYQLPADSYKGIDRTYIAYSQHYAINYYLQFKPDFNPISEWIDFARQTFGDCKNVGCIIQTHPDLFFKNCLFNLQNYMLTLLQWLTAALFPVKIIGKKIIHLGVLAGFFGLLVFVLVNPSARARFLQKCKDHEWLLLILFLFGLPSMGSAVIIFPRHHYLLMHSMLLVFVLAMLLNALPFVHKIKPAYWLLFFVPFLIKSPAAAKYQYYQTEAENKNQCNKKITEYISATHDGRPHVVFSNHLSFSMLLPPNFSDFNTEYEYKPGMVFSEILQEKKIDYVVVRDILLKEKLLSQDTTWINFMKNPAAYGFEKVLYGEGCDSYLLIKKP